VEKKQMEEKNFHIASVNMNGIDENKILNLNNFNKYDIIMIQETHSGLTKELIEIIEDKLNSIVITSNPKHEDIKGGVAIIIRSNRGISWERKKEGENLVGRLII
jgi:exonuclease III